MVQVVLAIHVMVCISLVILILLQQGKGAEVGAVFGGSSNTVFGASGAGNVLTRTTAALAALFFATSLYLAYTSSERASGSIFGASSGSVMSKHMTTKLPAAAPNSGSNRNAPANENPLMPNAEPNTEAPAAPAAPSTNK
ncbi:MAG TPA: preprotein translocase subunit SecG [Candidatus Binataceae bacterium]|nr:preprotein translocase subunit SecG [Candidatus Binataceae bacterium]